VEKGIKRDQLVVVGLPCPGMVDWKLLAEKYPETEAPVEISWKGDDFLLLYNGQEIVAFSNKEEH
jgi:hypothetical protein